VAGKTAITNPNKATASAADERTDKLNKRELLFCELYLQGLPA